MAVTRQVALSAPWLDDREHELVGDVLRSGASRSARRSTASRRRSPTRSTRRTPLPCRAGPRASTLLCVAAGVGPGDEVVTSPYSFVASANCAIYEGAAPVFADVDRRTLNLDPAAVEAALTERTRAVVAVDIYGYPCGARRAACALTAAASPDRGRLRGAGARYRGAPVGSHGPPAVFAFYPNKQITTGEGGMVTTHSEESGVS